MDKAEIVSQMELENRSRFSKELDDLLRKYRIPESASTTAKILKLIYKEEDKQKPQVLRPNDYFVLI